jgi:C2H2-type zinc finger protein
MGKKITLYCQDASGLKLGPNSEIVFYEGFATVDVEEFPEWADWAFHSGTPFIRVVDEGEATSAGSSHVCPICNKSFASAKALNGHLISHKPKTAPAQPKAEGKKAAEKPATPA